MSVGTKFIPTDISLHETVLAIVPSLDVDFVDALWTSVAWVLVLCAHRAPACPLV